MNFEELYKTYWDKIFRLCMGFVNDYDWAKDLAQETFITVWQKLSSFKNESSISTWIFRIATNKCLRQVENEKRIPKAAFPFEIEDKKEGRPDDKLKLLHTCIAQLNEMDRIIISLELEDIKQAEIAEIAGISEANVRVKIHRIKEKLTEKFSANMNSNIDFNALWKQQPTGVVPLPDEMIKKAGAFKKKMRLKLIMSVALLLLTAVFITWVVIHYKPVMLTTKIGALLVISAIIMYVLASAPVIALLNKNEESLDNQHYLQQLLLLKRKQQFIQNKNAEPLLYYAYGRIDALYAGICGKNAGYRQGAYLCNYPCMDCI